MAPTNTSISSLRKRLTKARSALLKIWFNLQKKTSINLGASISFQRQDFDSEFYLQKYPDVKAHGIDPAYHYMRFGYLEGRTGRFFDSKWYSQKYRAALGNAAPSDHYLTVGQARGFRARFVILRIQADPDQRNDYLKWIRTYEARLAPAAVHGAGPKLSVLMAVYNSEPTHLRAAIDSVLDQTFGNWELCIADDASTNPEIAPILNGYAARDSRIKLVFRSENGHISRATNSALELATGDYFGLLDHDDLLTPTALSHVAEAIAAHPEADLFYSDEDKIDASGDRCEPYFKPDFNYELLLAQNMISHFGVYRTSRVRALGGFRVGLEGAQDYDLAFRVLEASGAERIKHIPYVLYHWRAVAGSTALSLDEKSYASLAGRQVVEQHLQRTGAKAEVGFADRRLGHYRVRYTLSDPAALVSIIIPTRDKVDLLKSCIDSIFLRSTYKRFEIIIVDNGSVLPETKAYFAKIKSETVKIVEEDAPFNFSSLNNIGVRGATGKYICLLNNDIEILTPNWLEEMISFAQRPDVGCVGSRLWYPDHTLQHAGVILGIGSVAGHAHKHLDDQATGYFGRAVHHQSYSAVTGACLLTAKSKFDEVGGMTEALAVAFNDVDLCLKMVAAGYRNVWTPYAEMVHHESVSRGAEITIEQQNRFRTEIDYMLQTWEGRLQNDPAYNPNLTLEHEDYSLAWPPRLKLRGNGV